MKRENWIKWDINSRLGFKTALFFQEFGAQGYGAFICWVEMLYNAEGHKLPYDDKAIQNYTKLYKLIQSDTKKILEGLCSCGLFQHDDTHFWSPRVNAEVQRGSESSKRLSEIRKAAISTRWANKTSQNDRYKTIQNDTNDTKRYKTIQTCVDKRRSDQIIIHKFVEGGVGGDDSPKVNPPDGGTAGKPPEKINPQILSNGTNPEPEPETKKPKRIPRPKFDPTGKQKYGDWVYLSEKQKTEVVEYYKKKELDVEDLREAVTYLDAWFANNQNQRHHYVDDAKILKGWPLDRVLERKAKVLRVEREESFKYKTFTK